MEKLLFLSLASGSSGNCYYLGTSEYGILIDAGISIRTIKKTLKEKGLDFEKIMAVLITHDHADHIKTVGCLGEKYHIPVYATEEVHEGIDRSRYVEETLYQSRRTIEKEKPFLIRDFRIEAFEVLHDSSDNVGYRIDYGDCRFAIATDVGYITDTVSKYLSGVNHLVLEANYDNEMLKSGSYPDFLKERITCKTGHLSNREAADFLATHYTPRLKNVWLCHLSRENNHPELVYKTVDIRLEQEGIRVGRDVMLHVLKRMTPSELFALD
ncbi:MAG: MBL fold metallo-hydrolase [Tannerella sp.]|jgi:phosphoribosyl 1,2-cyclic phosphodiesterase|nr:MBL fold metallo-hydrolase [Tannerella sp.]